MRAFMPVFGLLFVIVFAVVGWLLSPSVLTALASVLPVNQLDPTIQKIVVTVAFGMLALIVFSLIAAVVSARPDKAANEADLAREKTALKAQQQADRDRLRKQGVRPPSSRR